MNTKRMIFSLMGILILAASLVNPTLVQGKPLSTDVSYMRLPGIGYAVITEACPPGTTNHGDAFHINGAAYAIDFSGISGFPIGTSVYAPANGEIIYAGDNGPGYGHLVKILDDHGLTHYLAHLSKIHAYVGQHITKGDLVGLSGKTGNSVPHLHWHVQDGSGNAVSLYSVSGMGTINCNLPNGTNSGDATGPALPSNSATSCSNYSGSEVALFDDTDCRGNVLRLSGSSSYSVQYNLNTSANFNDRARSIYIPNGWVVKVGGNVNDDPSTLAKCFTSTQTNLDTQNYDNTSIKIGYNGASDPDGWNMTSYAVVAQTGGCNAVASAIGGYVIGSASNGGGTVNGYPTGNENGFNTVAIFDNSNCSGTQYGWHDTTSGWFDLTSGNGPDYMNDISSCIRTDTGWSALVSSGFNGAGGQKCFTGPGVDLVHATYYNGTNMNNNISSVRVYNDSTCGGTAPEGVSAGDTVTIHVDPNYTNTQYGWHDPVTQNTLNYVTNNVTSIGVVPGWSVAVYENQDQGGGMFCFSQSDPDLTGNLFNNDSYINDNIESVQTFQDTTCGGLGAPPNVNLTYQITNPGNRTVEAAFSWSNAAAKWHVLYWGDGTEYSVYGTSGSTTVTHQYNAGDYTITFNVNGNDRQVYTVTEPISTPGFACDSAAAQNGVTLYEFENCSFVTEANYAEFTDPGFYNLTDYGMDNKATSLHVPSSGRSVRLYEGADKTGQSTCVSWDKWYMPLDTWPDNSVMENTISSIEVFDTVSCTPHPTMSITPVFLEPHGQIQLDTSWSGGCDGCWQIINWGDGTDYGMQGASGNQSPTKWYAGPGTYTVTFTVQNASPDWGFYTVQQQVVVNSYACGSSVSQTGVTLYKFSTCAYRDSSDYEEFTSAGTYNLSSLNDQSLSLHVPSGKSVLLYKDANQAGDSMCVSWDMWAMDLDSWPLGGTFDHSVSSIRVFDNTTCTP